ncbi:hypothetical protein JZO77_07600 [Enterococcus hulanensis]|uniref:hypothetical protein n=1 Tax=Enterococcus hulanensis TaxID=2559929 RepID=UPI001A8C8DFC|nr:hypothetical protein [Enterococcus hulanensis]MBO0456598.1 hypothetical protein [Enterococcus hulanensis]
MNTIIEKTLDALMKMAKQIPRGLMYLLIFTLLFPIQAKFIINNSLSLLKTALPSSVEVFLDRISTQYVINFFATTLILLFIAVIWDVAFKVDRGIEPTDYDTGILFEINGIGLISFLVFNKTSENPITIETISDSLNFSYFYFVSVLLSLIVFLFFFFKNNLFFLWIPFKKIAKISNLAVCIVLLIAYIMLLIFLLKYISKETIQGFIIIQFTPGLFT